MSQALIRVLLVGPFPKPLTGNSIANEVAFAGLEKLEGFEVRKIDTSTTFFDENVGGFSILKFWNVVKYHFKSYKILWAKIVYITPGQTFYGVLKYALIILLAKILRKKVIVHLHGNYLLKGYLNSNNLKKKLVKFILGRSDFGIVLSESLRPNLEPFIEDSNIVKIQNFVQESIITASESAINKKNLDELRIIYLSNLMLEKGILDLLEALEIMHNKGLKFHAKLAGNIDPNSEALITPYLNRLSEVEYMGVLEGMAKNEMLNWGNIFVFPTYYRMEGQPLAILEAMASGNVIVSTRHAGITDIMSLQNGLFVEKKNPEDIVRKLEYIAENKHKYEAVQQGNHQYAKTEFTTNRYIHNLQQVMNKACEIN